MTRCLGVVLACALALAACSGDGTQTGAAPAGGDPARGRQVYLAHCTTCHATDPAQDGPIGPAVKGASRELLEARVVRGSYPPSYTPKRNTSVMQPAPDLAASIPDLAAYLSRGEVTGRGVSPPPGILEPVALIGR